MNQIKLLSHVVSPFSRCYHVTETNYINFTSTGSQELVKFKKPTAKNIIDEVALDNYLLTNDETSGIIQGVLTTLKSMEDDPTNYRLHVENVHEFMRILWNKYDCEYIYDILDSLTKIEPALFDLERDPKAGKRYRDHYVHLFHVFIFGLRILSSIIRQLDDSKAKTILKVRDENLEGKICCLNQANQEVKFRDYPWKERLLYLWTLMSTLHDIAIPITHLENIRKALNEFSEKFHLEISGPNLVPSFPVDLDTYLCLISQLFEGKFEPDPTSDSLYNKVDQGAYIKGYFERLIINNHGVLGGFLVYKMIEEIFLQGKSTKYKIHRDSFQDYSELVLKQDVARATLAICLHDLKHNKDYAFPKFMPLSFDDYPLTFILIIADCLQEFLRWEGMSIRGDTKLYGFPALKVTTRDNKITVNCSFSVEKDPTQDSYFIQDIKRTVIAEDRDITIDTIGDATDEFCKLITLELKEKLLLGDSFTLMLSFF